MSAEKHEAESGPELEAIKELLLLGLPDDARRLVDFEAAKALHGALARLSNTMGLASTDFDLAAATLESLCTDPEYRSVEFRRRPKYVLKQAKWLAQDYWRDQTTQITVKDFHADPQPRPLSQRKGETGFVVEGRVWCAAADPGWRIDVEWNSPGLSPNRCRCSYDDGTGKITVDLTLYRDTQLWKAEECIPLGVDTLIFKFQAIHAPTEEMRDKTTDQTGFDHLAEQEENDAYMKRIRQLIKRIGQLLESRIPEARRRIVINVGDLLLPPGDLSTEQAISHVADRYSLSDRQIQDDWEQGKKEWCPLGITKLMRAETAEKDAISAVCKLTGLSDYKVENEWTDAKQVIRKLPDPFKD